MPTQKIDPKVIFASNAPAIDKPPVFGDKTKGWDVARANDGRPEISQMNKLQQDTDLKILWLNENAVLPYDASIDYPDSAVTLKDGSFKQLSGGSWVEFLDDFADKDAVKRGIANRYDSSLTYNSGERVVLANGDIVKSTVDGNVNDPNANMTGWVKTNSASQIFDESGLNQQEWNDGVESIADLALIPFPKNKSRVYVKGFYVPTNLALAQPYVGGDWFYYTETPSTLIQGLVVSHPSGGVWHRETKLQYSIEDFGALESKDAVTNGDAINIALANVYSVVVPSNKTFPCAMDKINFRSGNRLSGGGTLQGTDPDAQMADVSGTYFRIDNCDNVVIGDVKIKNGYKGKGVWMTNSRNVTFNDVTVDGFSYGMWIGENDDGVGCKYININRPKMLNQKYWSIYIRSLGVSNEANKTQFINCTKPYFYNANMAAFVVAEGHSKYITLDSPYFERCNVCMP